MNVRVYYSLGRQLEWNKNKKPFGVPKGFFV
jgi:hypothetical protein